MTKTGKAVIIGAGPAGLTAAYELLRRTGLKPVIYEATDEIGGISKTIVHNGNRMDIGGHRFFSKSDRVMNWWKEILPIQGKPASDDQALGRSVPVSNEENAPDPEKTDRVMLIRNRLSRIYFLRKFFNYPISLSLETFMNLGMVRVLRIGVSYCRARLFPIREETSLEDFLINRFGRELYATFFMDYTRKVWGLPCDRINPEWGAQRIKGLSVLKAVSHALRNIVRQDSSIDQKNTETSLIEQFLYPKLGPGQMWETVARLIQEKGGEIHLNHAVTGIVNGDGAISAVRILDRDGGRVIEVEGDVFFSTMPVRDLIAGFQGPVPETVRAVAGGLMYRDFMTVGLLLKKMKLSNRSGIPTVNDIVPDNWIYIQEREVRLGRLQIFNNWSPYMVKDPDTVWIGLEYFCDEGDDLWSMEDDAFVRFAIDELASIGVIDAEDVLDHVVVRVPKTYPAYFGTYDRFDEIRCFTDGFNNLFLIGRNGMHRYNNADHSMLTAMVAVDNIVHGVTDKTNVWQVNTESIYHESK